MTGYLLSRKMALSLAEREQGMIQSELPESRQLFLYFGAFARTDPRVRLIRYAEAYNDYDYIGERTRGNHPGVCLL